MKKNIVTIICTLLFLSCSNNQKDKLQQVREIASKNTKIATTNYFTKKNTPPPVILKIPNPEDGQIVLKDLIEKIDFIALETLGIDSQIGEINKIISHENLYFILDTDVTHKVFVFNKDGKFICNIGKKGRGKGEYVSLTDITINKESKNIILFDRDQNKFLFFDFKGVFLKEILCNEYQMDGVDNIQHYKNDLFLTSSNNSTSILLNPDLAYNLRLFSMDKDEVLSRHFGENEIKSLLLYETANIYSPFNGGYNYSASWENKIYHIKGNQIQLSYELDFGKEGIPKDFYETHTNGKTIEDLNQKIEIIKKASSDIIEKKYSYIPHVFLESDDHVFLKYLKDSRNLMVYYNKKSTNIFGSSYNSVKGLDLYYLPIICFPIAINEQQEFIGNLNPFQMYEIYEQQKAGRDDKIIREALKKEYPKFYEVFSKVDKNDNPVIAIWKFKDF